MKYFLISVITIAFLWGMLVPDSSPWISYFKTTTGAPMWGVGVLFLCDFFMSMRGKNSPYMQEFHAQIKNDVFACIVLGLTLWALFASLPTRYSFSNVDLAGLGLPFLFLSLVQISKLVKMKVAGSRIRASIVWIMLIINAAAYVLIFMILREVLQGGFTTAQSLWIQITVLFTSLYAFFSANQIRFVIEKERMEVSPILLSIFSDIKFIPGIYKKTEQLVADWNDAVDKKKAEKKEQKEKARQQKSAARRRRSKRR